MRVGALPRTPPVIAQALPGAFDENGGSPLVEGATMPLYSDIMGLVASRPSSRPSSPASSNAGTPERGGSFSDRVDLLVPAKAAGSETTRMRKTPSGVSPTRSTSNTTGLANHESFRRKDVVSSDGWTTVTRRRRAHSLDSASRSEANVTMNVGKERALAPPVLTNEQSAAIASTMQQLTNDERTTLARRYEAVNTAGTGNGNPDGSPSDSSVHSAAPVPGPSQDKGKNVDPRNWGGIDWDSDELDVKAQATALKQLEKKKKSKKQSKKSSAAKLAPPLQSAPITTTPRIDSIIHNVPRREQSVLPLPSIFHAINPPRAPQIVHEPRDQENGRLAAAARPAAQIPARSGLAVALQAAGRLNGGLEPLGDGSKKDSRKKSDKKRKKRSDKKKYKKAKKAKYNRKQKARRSRQDTSPSDSSADSSKPDGGDDSRRGRRRVPSPLDGHSSPSDSSTSDLSSDTSSSSDTESSSDDEEDTRMSKHILSNMKVFKYNGSQNIRNFVRHVRKVVSSLE